MFLLNKYLTLNFESVSLQNFQMFYFRMLKKTKEKKGGKKKHLKYNI